MYRYSMNGVRRDFSIGPAKHITITAAKAKAADLKKMIAEGIDPKDVRRKAKLEKSNAPRTFREFAPEAIKAIQSVRVWTNEKHIAQWRTTIDKYAMPELGDLEIGEITKHDVVRVLEPIWTTKTETADKVRGRLEAIFDHAVALGLIEHNPAIWKGGLATFLPPLSKIHKVKHFNAMPFAETPEYIFELAKRGKISHLCSIFGILTATRAQEFVGTEWKEIDLENAVWTIPAERMKCKLEHRVPLSLQAMKILQSLPKRHRLVFPAPRTDGRMSLETPRATVRNVTGKDYTAHGFRSTFRDWCEENFIHEALAERSLAHVKGDKVVQAYQRSDLLEQRRPIMQQWADAIMPMDVLESSLKISK